MIGGTGQSEHDRAWTIAESATEGVNRFVRMGAPIWLGPRVEHRFPDRWVAWVERETKVLDHANEVHVFAPTEAQALRQLAQELMEHPPE